MLFNANQLLLNAIQCYSILLIEGASRAVRAHIAILARFGRMAVPWNVAQQRS